VAGSTPARRSPTPWPARRGPWHRRASGGVSVTT